MLRQLALVALALVQATMFAKQFYLGFVPMRTEPQRVPLSWDMFATRVERCNLRWDPPVRIEHTLWRDFSELHAPLEWQVIFDRTATYRTFARETCRYTKVPTRILLHCHLPNGTQTDETLACPLS